MATWMDAWMDEWVDGNCPRYKICAPHLVEERRTGYYKKRYQQSSQEQMVRQSYAQTGSSCQYSTDREQCQCAHAKTHINTVFDLSKSR